MLPVFLVCFRLFRGQKKLFMIGQENKLFMHCAIFHSLYMKYLSKSEPHARANKIPKWRFFLQSFILMLMPSTLKKVCLYPYLVIMFTMLRSPIPNTSYFTHRRYTCGGIFGSNRPNMERFVMAVQRSCQGSRCSLLQCWL